MSSKFNKLFRKWSCFGAGKTPNTEDDIQNELRRNQPKIVITECKSVGTSPTFSRQSSSSSSAQSNQSDEAIEAEIFLKTDGEEHKMGLDILVRTRSFDEKDGRLGDNDNVSIVRVTNVEIGSFAHGFGVRKDDIISKVNGTKCGSDVLNIKEAFICGDSDELQMEILRNVKNQETGTSELLKMTISNGGTTKEELEIIQITGSSWSLSDVGTYFNVGEQRAFLQFESEDSPWIVNDSNRLTLTTNLSKNEVRTDAKFCMHQYWSHLVEGSEIPVVLQHVTSGLCVALVGGDIKLVEEHSLDYVTNQSIIFLKRVPYDATGSQVTFQSALDPSRYLGFNTRGRSADGYAVPIFIGDESTFGERERNVVFIENDHI